MVKRRVWAVVVLTTTAALLIGLMVAGSAAAMKKKGTEGCTPGYWKQSQHFDSWPSAYKTSDDWDTTFGVNLLDPDKTLLQSLMPQQVGGVTGAFVRHATAALLNASADVPVHFKWNTTEVIDMVHAAITSGDLEGAKDMFEAQNQKGCPLN